MVALTVVELVGTTLQHLGPLHPAERALTLVLAFGPFVLLALALWITRQRGSELEQGGDVRQDNDGNGP